MISPVSDATLSKMFYRFCCPHTLYAAYISGRSQGVLLGFRRKKLRALRLLCIFHPGAIMSRAAPRGGARAAAVELLCSSGILQSRC